MNKFYTVLQTYPFGIHWERCSRYILILARGIFLTIIFFLLNLPNQTAASEKNANLSENPLKIQPDFQTGKTTTIRTNRPIKKYSYSQKAHLYDYLSTETRQALEEKRRYIIYLQKAILKDNQTCINNIANSQKRIQELFQVLERARAKAAKENRAFTDDTIVSVYTGGFKNARQTKEAIKELENHITVIEKKLSEGGCGHGYVGGYIDVKGMEEAIESTNKDIRMMTGGKELKDLSPEQKVIVEQRFLKYYEAQGVDTKKLIAFRDSLLRRINTLKPIDDLGGILDSIGFTNKEELSSMEIGEWQEKVSDYVLTGWLKSITSGNVYDFQKEVKKLGTNVGKFDESLRLQTEGAFEQIKGDQKLIEDLMKSVPYVDKAMDALEIVTGESLSGDKKGPMERIVNGVLSYGPGSMDMLANKNPALKKTLKKLGDKVSGMKDSIKARMAAKMKISTKELDTALSYLSKGEPTQSEVALKKAYKESKKRFTRSKDGAFYIEKLSGTVKDREIYLKTLKQLQLKRAPFKISKELYTKTELSKQLDVSENIKKWAVNFDKKTKKIQKDKITQALLKRDQSHSSRQFARLAELSIQKRYRGIDRKVAGRLSKEPGVKNNAINTLNLTALKEKISVDELTYTIEPVKISNPETKDELTFNRKDEVVYQVKIRKKTADNESTESVINESDVEHIDARRIYAEEYWKELNDTEPASSEMDEKKLREYTKKHDLSGMSYDKYENYNTWDMTVEDYVSRTKKPSAFEIQNLISSAEASSGKWFNQAQSVEGKEEKSSCLNEGMAQALHFYDNRLIPKLKSSSPYNYQHLIPEKIRHGINLFRQVDNLLIPPEEAEFILAKQYNLPENLSGSASMSLLHDLTAFMNDFEKTQWKNKRVAYADLLRKRLSFISSKENNMSLSETLSDGIQKINYTLQRQLIKGDQYMSVRENFLKERLKFAKETNQTTELNHWASAAFQDKKINRNELDFLK